MSGHVSTREGPPCRPRCTRSHMLTRWRARPRRGRPALWRSPMWAQLAQPVSYTHLTLPTILLV
eukprot:2679702-Pyramimonas_sp.AAC.1